MPQIKLGRFPGDIVLTAKALGNATRFSIAVLLEEEGRLRFTDLRNRTGEAPGALSPHLQTLITGGIVRKTTSLAQKMEYYELSARGKRILEALYQSLTAPSQVAYNGVLPTPPPATGFTTSEWPSEPADKYFEALAA